MTRPIRNRSRLLVSSGSAALALGLALALPQRAEAQAINASGSVVQGSASIDDMVPGETTVSVFSRTAVIDWTPTEDNNGDALDFLPTNTTAFFLAGDSIPDFAVLNRILPSTNGNVVVMDGSVISRIFDQAGNAVPGGFVAFYSPTGILVGNNATFDVGSLLLTTLEPDLASFQNFVENNGTLALAASPGSTARIQIDPGALVIATPENAFFSVVAADVQMSGTSIVNGSQAYVAGEVVNLRFSNGLFDIEIPTGTAASGTVMQLDGTVTGPASNGPGDNHVIYGVAAAQNDPISMLFRGNLGFAPAQQAGIVNGEIILSANYDVFGRTVNNGTSTDGINARFDGNLQTSSVQADIFIEDVVATSSLLAIGTHTTRMSAINTPSGVDGNLLLVGGQAAELQVGAGLGFDVTGDLLVSADAYGLVSGDLADPSEADAAAGAALISAGAGGLLTIGGNLRVSADAYAGLDFQTGTAGRAQGGSARFVASDAGVAINGQTSISARGLGSEFSGVLTDGEVRGGLAELLLTGQSDMTINQELTVTAEAIGRAFGATVAANAFGGTARVANSGGTLTLLGDTFINASATGADSFATGNGALADAGEAVLEVSQGGQTTIAGLLSLSANALAGNNFAGRGGDALGGVALATTQAGGSLVVESDLFANAEAIGGNGSIGGDAAAGIAGAIAISGTIDLQSDAQAVASAEGGNAETGFGGAGGNALGGTALLRADGNLNETASLTIGGVAGVFAEGFGGFGGRTDGTIRGGRGGNGQGGSAAIANQADPGFVGGAYLLAGGDNGTLSVGAQAFLSATGTGGAGGEFNVDFTGEGPEDAGDGGDGIGGWAQAGVALLAGDGSLGLGSASFGSLRVEANGFAGRGGFNAGQTFLAGFGVGGSGTGGDALLTASAGTVSASDVDLSASGFGGDSDNGADGTGGRAGLFGELGGEITIALLFANAEGFGGSGFTGVGGNGIGGEAFIQLQGVDVTVNGDAFLNANGFGGFTGNTGGNGGDGTGGTAYIGFTAGTPGSGTITGNASIVANGFGGGSGDGATGGTGRGGTAYAQALGGSTVRFGTLQVTASGRGGENEGGIGTFGGNGFGGTAELRSLGSGSQLIIERNFGDDFSSSLNGGGIVAALGLGAGGFGGSGVGGDGTGGNILLRAALGGSIALPLDPLNDPGSNGANLLLAYGRGGDSQIEGSTGGNGTGGTGTIEVDSGTFITGATEFAVWGQGGSSLEPTLNIAGGDGFGGTRRIRVLNGGELTLELAGGISGGLGGNGTGTGDGGNAFGGNSFVELVGGTLNIVGNFVWRDQTTGGIGNNGGDASGAGQGGGINFSATDSVITFQPDANGESSLVLGGMTRGGDGIATGGNARAADAVLTLQNTDLGGINLTISPVAVGGNASGAAGIGGNATGSLASFNAADSTIALLDEVVISADARGGTGGSQGSGGTGGNAQAGTAGVNFQNSQVTFAAASAQAGILRVRSQADGGDGDQIGDAFASVAQLSVDGGSLDADGIAVEARGFANANSAGQTGGAAAGGAADFIIGGAATIGTGRIDLLANAQSSAGGTARAGQAVFRTLAGSTAQVTADDLFLFADAFGSDDPAGNIAGRVGAEARGGTVSLGNLTGSAIGDVLDVQAQPSTLVGDGGSLLVSGTLGLNVLGDIQVRTGQGGIVGSAVNTATTTAIALNADGIIEIIGDDDTFVGLGGDSIALTARDLEILSGARIGARSVSVTSLETDFTAVLGGTVAGEGFTLTADEVGRISADAFSLFVPEVVATSDPNQPDLLIRDLTLDGTGGGAPGGFGSVQLLAGGDVSGIIRVEGTLRLLDAGPSDVISIRTGERIEVVTPGGIMISDVDNLPGGTLSLNAGSIWAADADVIAQLQADPAFAGRDALLAVAAAGSDDPLGYLRAGAVSIGVGSQLLVRNTGIAFEQGGILVGGGGLTIGVDGQFSQGTPLDVFAYGRRQRDDGTFVTGADFFREVNFNLTGQFPATYLDASAFNDCIINTGECPQPPPPPPPSSPEPNLPPLNNPTLFVDPLTMAEPVNPTPGEQNEQFGLDFPERPEAPLISEDPLLDDPVTSGSDASLYTVPAGSGGKEK
jgi:hypothetical protein